MGSDTHRSSSSFWGGLASFWLGRGCVVLVCSRVCVGAVDFSGLVGILSAGFVSPVEVGEPALSTAKMRI